MISPTVLIILQWYPPRYWWHPSTVLNILQSTRFPPKYCTVPQGYYPKVLILVRENRCIESVDSYSYNFYLISTGITEANAARSPRERTHGGSIWSDGSKYFIILFFIWRNAAFLFLDLGKCCWLPNRYKTSSIKFAYKNPY